MYCWILFKIEKYILQKKRAVPKKLKWHHDCSWSLFDKVSDNVVAFLDNFLNPGQSKTVDAGNSLK